MPIGRARARAPSGHHRRHISRRHRTAGLGKRTRGMPFDIAHGSIGQRRRARVPIAARSPATRPPGCPRPAAAARSEYESRVRVRLSRRSTPSWSRVAAQPRGARLTDERRRGHEPRVSAVAHLELAPDHDVEQRRERPDERLRGRRDEASCGDRPRGARGSGGSPRGLAFCSMNSPTWWSISRCDALDGRALVPAEERPEEVPAVAPVDLQVGRDPSRTRSRARRGHSSGRQVGHPRPDVGLDDVRRDDRALHVEQRDDRMFALAGS